MTKKQFSWFKLTLCVLIVTGCGSPTPAQLLDDARNSIESGDLATANIHLMNVLADEPDNSEARFLIGRVMTERGNFSAGEQHLRRARELGVTDPVLTVTLIQALVGQGKFEQAVREFENGPELEGAERVALLRVAATAYQGNGDPDQAERLLGEALALNPGSEPARTELAVLLLRNGSSEEASELIANVLSINDEYAPALLVRGQIELQQGNRDAAEQTLADVLDLVGPGDRTFARAKSILAEIHLDRGDIETAQSDVDELLAINAQDPVARYLQARIERARGDDAAAEALVEALIAEFPDFVMARQLMGVIKADQGQFGQAEMHLQSVVVREPENQSAKLILAQTYMRQGKMDEARRALADVVPADTSDVVMYALAGRTSQQFGDSQLASEFFERSESVEDMTPEEAFALANFYATSGEFERATRLLSSDVFTGSDSDQAAQYLMALVQAQLGNLDAAAEAAAELAESSPDVAWPLSLQGGIALVARDFQAARNYFEEARTIEPGNSQVLINLARAELLIGDEVAAREVLRRAVDIDPSQTAALGALTELALRAGDLEDARTWLGQLPDSPGRLRLAGQLAIAEGQPDEAADVFSELYEREPSQRNAIQVLNVGQLGGMSDPAAMLRDWLDRSPDDSAARFALGSYELQQGNLDAARVELEEVTQDNPDSAAALNNLALTYQAMGDSRATEFARRAYEASPQNAAIADTLGWIHVSGGQADVGLPYLEQAAAELRESKEVQYHWAVALEETGDLQRAAGVYESLLADGTQFPGRDDAERRFAALRR